MANLILDKIYNIKSFRTPRCFTLLCSALKKAIDMNADFSILKNKLANLFTMGFRNEKLWFIVTTGAFDDYEVTATCLYAESNIYRNVYRLKFYLKDHVVFVGEISKISA